MTLQFSIKGLWTGAIQLAIVLFLTVAVPLAFSSLPEFYLSIIWLSSWALSIIFLEGEEKLSALTAVLINSMAAIFLMSVSPAKGIILLMASLSIPLLHQLLSKTNNSSIVYLIGPATVFTLVYFAERFFI
ncbi:hypothetical protein [Ekhidna sp.]|uniref:hypothetical protein n=1 Tax=Ekhidna sp. TaxID=2608089 RepID=UPI003BA9B8E3